MRWYFRTSSLVRCSYDPEPGDAGQANVNPDLFVKCEAPSHQSATAMIKGLVRRALDRQGYVLWKRDFMRFGNDPWLDVNRLSRAWGKAILTVFDVGANDGATLVEMLPAFPVATVHSFEPLRETFERLKARVSDPRAQLHNLALGEICGPVPFYVYGSQGDGSLMNSLTPDAGFARRGGWEPKIVEVQSLTLDAFCESEKIDRIDVLKMDTEGFDLAVLRGSERMLREARVDFVYLEFNDLLDREGIAGGSLLPISQFLGNLGLRYVTTYTDFVQTDGPMWVCANALFARDPRA